MDHQNMIEQRQDELIAEFLSIGSGFDRYSYLLELSALLRPLPAELRTDDRAVRGCQSNVWLDMHASDDGIFSFDADSDTLIIKGVLYLLQYLYDGQDCALVAATPIRLFEETEIMASFGDARQKGIGYVLRTLQDYAGAHIV